MNNNEENVNSSSKAQTSPEMSSLFFPPSSEELEEARDRAMKKRRMWQVVKEVTYQLVFIWCFTVVCYGNRTSDRYRMTNTLYNTFRLTHKVRFNNIRSKLKP